MRKSYRFGRYEIPFNPREPMSPYQEACLDALVVWDYGLELKTLARWHAKGFVPDLLYQAFQRLVAEKGESFWALVDPDLTQEQEAANQQLANDDNNQEERATTLGVSRRVIQRYSFFIGYFGLE